MQKFNKEGKYPNDRCYRRTIRNATACLQALIGENISTADSTIAAQIICDKLPVLKDPAPGHFPSHKQFPYWVGTNI